jgi:redox-sensitive bicupin YhaK (pirin superfamily)
MQFIHTPKNKQSAGNFNQGEIEELRPIMLDEALPHLKPHSNLFYWANAWANRTSTIGLHPHKGFEILSFVLKGTIEHYDTKLRTWISLKAGDVQIIRSGNGISHSEKINEGGEMFQIWFDPHLQKSVGMPASYDDYAAEDFPISEENGIKTRFLKGENAPIEMLSEGVEIFEMKIADNVQAISFSKDKIYACFVLSGSLKVEGNSINDHDFFKVWDTEKFCFTENENLKLFVIATPAKLSYVTYAQRWA